MLDWAVKCKPTHWGLGSRSIGLRICGVFVNGVVLGVFNEVGAFECVPECCIIVVSEWIEICSEGTRDYRKKISTVPFK